MPVPRRTPIALTAVIAAALLSGCAGSPPAPSSPPASSPSTSALPTATAVPTATPSLTPTPSSAPTASSAPPVATPTASPGPGETATPTGRACTTLPFTRPSSAIEVRLVTVRAAAHPGYDRVVWEFAGSAWPQVEVAAATPPFAADGSGLPITLEGPLFLRVVLRGLATAYDGPQYLLVRLPELREVRMQGHYEGIGSWLLGLASTTCADVFTLTAPNRLVIDLSGR